MNTNLPSSPGRATSFTDGWRVWDPHAPQAGLRELLHVLESAVTVTVGHPFRLVDAIALQAQVRGLVVQRPGAIVLDVDGLLPVDEMGVLMLPAVARDAANEGVAVVLTNPSRPLHDRLLQLGVRDLTFVERPTSTPPEHDCTQEADGHDAALPSSPCPFCAALAKAT